MSNETDPVVQTEPAAAESITASVRKPRAKRVSPRTSQNRAGRRASGKTKTAAPAPKMGMLNKLVNGSIVIAVFVTALAIQRIVPTEHIAAPKVEALPAQTAVAPTTPTTPETATVAPPVATEATPPVAAPTIPTTPAVAPAVSTTPAAPVAAPAPVATAAASAPQATTPAPAVAAPTVAPAAPVAATTPAAPVAVPAPPVATTTPAAPVAAPAPVVASAPAVAQALTQPTTPAPLAQPCVAPAPQPIVATVAAPAPRSTVTRASRRTNRDGYSGGRTDDRKTALNSGGAEDLDNPSIREHYINTSKLAKRAASPAPAAEANRTELPAAVPNRVR